MIRTAMISVIATAYTTTAHAQIDGGALEYMLQRPRIKTMAAQETIRPSLRRRRHRNERHGSAKA